MILNHWGMFLNSQGQRGSTKPDQKEFFLPQEFLDFLGAYGFQKKNLFGFDLAFDLDDIE